MMFFFATKDSDNMSAKFSREIDITIKKYQARFKK